MGTEITALSIKELQDGLKKKQFSAKEVALAYLERIKKYDSAIGSFLTITEEEAIEGAERADKLIGESVNLEEIFQNFPLLGVPVAHKDLYLTKGIRTTAASKVLENCIPQYSSTIVRRMEEAGAILLGKLNCDAWAHGSSGENSDFYPTKNPWNFEHVPGGSSSGSGAAVAAGFTPAATGTDTGGSIRLPASFCGVTGIKPTYGRTSRYGVVAMASSLDSMGFLTKTVEDAALLLQVTAGRDENDATTIREPVPNYLDSARRGLTDKGLRIGMPKEYFAQGLDSEVKKALEDAANVLEQMGAEIKEMSLPNTEYAIPVYYLIMSSEVSSNLARYDGIRFGKPREYFGDEAKRRIMLGTHALSSGYKDKYYGRATEVRALIAQDFEEAFKEVDVLLAPVSPIPPFKLGEKNKDPLDMYLSDVLLAAVNLAGLPALSLPCGLTKNNLPIGMQLIGSYLSEEVLFRLGHAYQEATDWHYKRPQVSSTSYNPAELSSTSYKRSLISYKRPQI